MRRAGGLGAWRPTLPVSKRSARVGLLQLRSSEEDGEAEEAAREEVRSHVLPSIHYAQRGTLVCNEAAEGAKRPRPFFAFRQKSHHN